MAVLAGLVGGGIWFYTTPHCTHGLHCYCGEVWHCEDGLECRWGICWDPADKPEAYVYSQTSLADQDLVYDQLRTLIRTQLKPGDKAADLGAGTGALTWELATAVGDEGRVHATDISQDMLDVIAKHRDEYGMSWINLHLVAGERDTGLTSVPDGSLAFILIINSIAFGRVDHSDDLAYLSTLRSKLKPGGRVVYHRDWLDDTDAGREAMLQLAADAGFARTTEIAMPDHIPEESWFLSNGPRTLSRTRLRRGYVLSFYR